MTFTSILTTDLLLLDSPLWTKDDANLIGSQYPLTYATLNSAG